MQRSTITLRATLLAALLGACMSACGISEEATEKAPLISVAGLQAGLNQLQLNSPDVQGFAVAVLTPDGAMVSAATGQADPEGRKMTSDTPVRIASITKTMVAASILRLWEEGLIDLDASIGGLISPEHGELLKSDGYNVEAISVRHVLMHVSGLNDHFAGDAFKGMVVSEPDRRWTRTDQVRFMVETTDSLGEPGETFSYSDTGYILLGEMIERITQEPLGQAVRRLARLDGIGLQGSWWDVDEAPSADVPHRAHQWLGEVDTYHIHGSVDAYGGGGIVASVEDIARFFSAFFNGDVFANADTLEIMIKAPGHPDGSPYRMGLFAGELGGHTKYGHGGFWGTDVFVLPDLGIVISGVALNAAGINDLKRFEAMLVEEHLTDAAP